MEEVVGNLSSSDLLVVNYFDKVAERLDVSLSYVAIP